MGELFWQKESLLQYTMNLLQGPKDPVMPNINLSISAKHLKSFFN